MYKLPYTGAEIEERLAKLDDLNAENFLLSETTADLYGLSGVDANVDKALDKIGPKLYMNYKTFTKNGTFIVPAGVTQLKISGCGAGGKGGAQYAQDNLGGKAGQYLIDSVYSVTPGQSLTIVCGKGNTTISQLGIILLANSLQESYPNFKLGFLTGIQGNTKGGAYDGGGYGGAFGYGGAGDTYNSGHSGVGAFEGAGGMGGTAGEYASGDYNGKDGKSSKPIFTYLDLFDDYIPALGGKKATTSGKGGNGGYYGSGGMGRAYGSGAEGGGAGGFGAGGGAVSSTAVDPGEGSQGFILIEW